MFDLEMFHCIHMFCLCLFWSICYCLFIYWYSQTCIKRSLLVQKKHGLMWQVTS